MTGCLVKSFIFQFAFFIAIYKRTIYTLNHFSQMFETELAFFHLFSLNNLFFFFHHYPLLAICKLKVFMSAWVLLYAAKIESVEIIVIFTQSWVRKEDLVDWLRENHLSWIEIWGISFIKIKYFFSFMMNDFHYDRFDCVHEILCFLDLNIETFVKRNSRKENSSEWVLLWHFFTYKSWKLIETHLFLDSPKSYFPRSNVQSMHYLIN